jgi:hypothetical protein
MLKNLKLKNLKLEIVINVLTAIVAVVALVLSCQSYRASREANILSVQANDISKQSISAKVVTSPSTEILLAPDVCFQTGLDTFIMTYIAQSDVLIVNKGARDSSFISADLYIEGYGSLPGRAFELVYAEETPVVDKEWTWNIEEKLLNLPLNIGAGTAVKLRLKARWLEQTNTIAGRKVGQTPTPDPNQNSDFKLGPATNLKGRWILSFTDSDVSTDATISIYQYTYYGRDIYPCQ